jgi:glycosyltransferase involved in cell wall biosynthesis
VSLAYSVVIPAYNAAATIRETIASAMAQTIPPREIIVVDDGSTDATAAVAGEAAGPVVVIQRENSGPGGATTAGMRRVSQPFFATLDADDLWLPHKIARQAAELERAPDVAGVFALARMFHDGAAPDPDGPGAIVRLWTRTTLLFRTEAAQAVGDFGDLPGRMGEVIDWLSRSRDLGQRHVMVEEILALRRIRPGSLSYGLTDEQKRGYLLAVHDAMRRRKQRLAEAAAKPAV